MMKSKVRESNVELYRIVLMLLTIAHHYVVNSGLQELMKTDMSSLRSLLCYIFGMWGKTGINCFVLITGYYMCTSKISISKFFKLLLEVEFYNVSIWLIFLVTGYESLSVKSAFFAVWPIQSITDGFAACYLVFFLFIPFLNVVVRNIDKKAHRILVLLLLAVYTLMGDFPLIKCR